MEDVVLQVSDFIGLVNQTLEFAYPQVTVEGEVSGFKISKNKWVFFDLKDEHATVNCFMTVYQLKTPIEDGMRLKVSASPKITKWGRFSITVNSAQLSGEGSLKRAFELLKIKLHKEGLFAEERKRSLPQYPQRIGVVSSSQAAGYADFLKIVNSRWGGLEILLADVQVQGDAAPGQITKALDYFNQMEHPVDVVVVIRGGGSSDDLQAFSTEPVVRAVAASRSPIVVGVGHETDVSLADLAADVRAATPTHAAELVVPDRTEMRERIERNQQRLPVYLRESMQAAKQRVLRLMQLLGSQLLAPKGRLEVLQARLDAYNPEAVLAKGYSLVLSANGEVVSSIKHIQKGDTLNVKVRDGTIGAIVDDKKSN